MVNDVELTICGNVGERPTLYTGGKTPFTRVSVATTPRIKRGEEWTDGTTQWYTVKAWGAFAENITQSLQKGDAVVVTGAVRFEQYTNSQGNPVSSPIIDARAIGLDLRWYWAKSMRVHKSPAQPAEGDDAERSEPGQDPQQQGQDQDPTDVSGLHELADGEPAPSDEDQQIPADPFPVASLG